MPSVTWNAAPTLQQRGAQHWRCLSETPQAPEMNAAQAPGNKRASPAPPHLEPRHTQERIRPPLHLRRQRRPPRAGPVRRHCRQRRHRQHPVVELHRRRVLEEVAPGGLEVAPVLRRDDSPAHEREPVSDRRGSVGEGCGGEGRRRGDNRVVGAAVRVELRGGGAHSL